MFNLTTPQQNIWNLQKYYEGTSISNICGIIYFEDTMDLERLKAAINHVIEHQSGLRLRFCEKDGCPVQWVSEYQFEEIPVIQFKTRESLHEYAVKYAKTPITLTDNSMYCFTVFQVGSQTGALVVLNHLIADAWTVNLIVRQVLEAYEKQLGVEKFWDYVDHIYSEERYLRSISYEKDRDFWRAKYTERPESGKIKLYTPSVLSIDAKRITRTLSSGLTKDIQGYCENYSITPAVFFETVMVIYLKKINPGNKSVTIGIPILNRNGIAEKNMAGMFVSTIPMTVEISETDTVETILKKVTYCHKELFRHQRYPYTHILENLREKESFSGNLYDVMVSFQNSQTGLHAETEWLFNGYSEIPLVIHIDNRDGNDSYTWSIDYQTGIFEQETEIYLIINRLEHVISQILSNISIPLKKISVIPSTEYYKIVEDFNDTAVDYKRDRCIHEIFREQAKRTPDKEALIFEGQAFTYRQLDNMSDSLAYFLRKKGIGRNDVVPIIAERSWHVVVAMLGIFKAGGAYMAAFPGSFCPEDRIRYMISEVSPKLILKYGCEVSVLGKVEIVDLAGFDFFSEVTVVENINTVMDNFAVIFTSGTTGLPKGTVLHHLGAVNFAYANNALYTKCEYIIAMSIITFDAFFLDTICPMMRGLTCILANEKEQFDAKSFSALVERYQNLGMFTTPTKILQLISGCLDKSFLQHFNCLCTGGEVFSEKLYNIFVSQNKEVNYYNVYGPTETTMWVSEKKITGLDDISIGRPLANTQIYILDDSHRPLPVGIAGELCISGDGVGKGYLNCTELTAEKFIPNPFIKGRKIYCTGDLARWRADGEIEFLGRIDTQVKIRGLRIELGEIEAVMGSFLGIGMVAVADKKDENGRQYLVGYYTAKENINQKELRRYLESKLPNYMVPNYLMCLEQMPMTPSGKTDKKKLPVPNFLAQAEEYIAPATDTEKRIAAIWKEMLNVEKVGKADNFFELGGDSLLAISVLNKINTYFQIELSMKDIMENPVLEKIAEAVDKADPTERKITVNQRKRYRLLPQQKAIYAACQKRTQSLAYNMPARIQLPGHINRDRLRHCIETVVAHHKSLKTYIVSEGSEIYGIYNEETNIVFEEYRNQEYKKFLRPFVLEKAPLIHVGFTEDSVLFDAHHIIADGESLNIILRDIAVIYEGGNIATADIEYSDYAGYFYQKDFSVHKEYFKNMLQCDFVPVELPVKRTRAESGDAVKVFRLKKTTFEETCMIAKRYGLTETMLFFGAFGILLSKYTARKDILTSIVLSNRSYAELSDVVGMFVNTLPVYMQVSGDIHAYFTKIKDLVLNLFAYQELPFFEIADAVGMSDKSVVNTAFVYQADGKKHLTIDEWELVPELLETGSTKFDLLFEMTPDRDGCTIRVEYDCGKYDQCLISELFASYEKILGQLTKKEIADISILSDEQYKKIIFDFNDTTVDYPSNKCIYELFQEQVKLVPDKIALIFENKRFNYQQIDELSNGLAASIRDLGIHKGDRVAVLLGRDENVILVQLAVLKIGAVFIPIDRRYPRERIEYILEESSAKIIIKNSDNHLEFRQAKNIEDIAIHPINTIEHEWIDTNDTCYIIFTSGSTGKPKGCTLTNKGLVNFCRNNNILEACKSLEQQIVISVNTISFDYFIAESLLPLMNGYTIVLSNEEENLDPEQFIKLVEATGANIIQTTPTRYKLYFDKRKDLTYMKQFGVIVTSGEPLSLELLNVFRKYSHAQIFNPLGPSECSVWAVGGELSPDSNEITIGRPIANTQVYILDQDHNPLPIGVAGELCISGDGVGNGYFSHPEMTVQKFIPNPFIEGERMYCTGDLVRWRIDGKIEYLGRIDTQVKIHGLRIELGEIESVMGSFPGIDRAVVTNKTDTVGRQYLAGYYTARNVIDEKMLRWYLALKLPRYMVPNYFMHMSRIPVTPSGKTDRKNLPEPEAVLAFEERVYVPPCNEKERALCKIIEEILGCVQVGIKDNFFELGGDSLKAIEFMARSHEINIYFTLQNVFDYPTVEALYNYLQNKSGNIAVYEKKRFARYAAVLEKNTWNPDFIPQRHKIGTALLTGATGFLGAHILDTLIKKGVGKIYCLVRGDSERIFQRLRYYFGNQYIEKIEGKIIPIIGDLETDNISHNLPMQVDYIIHAAASVKHYGSWQYFKKINVDGTRRIVEYAQKVGARYIHISTISVSGNDMADRFKISVSAEEKHFSESSLYIEQPLDNVYVRSKFEAEMIVLDAMQKGLQANIIRVGNLTNRRSDLKFQPNYKENAFLKRIKAILELGCLPDYLMPIYAEFSPVDSTAEAITAIVEHMNSQYTVFHVNSNQKLYFNQMLKYLEHAGYPMELIDGKQFAKRIRDTLNSQKAYIFETLSSDLGQNDQLQYDSNIHIENDFTVRYLKSIGFTWPEIDYEYVEGYLYYFKQLGYLGEYKYDKK